MVEWRDAAVLPLQWIGYGLMILGLAGAVLPIVPGPLLIWLGAFLWAWEDGFQRIGWPTLLLLGLLALVAAGLDTFLTLAMSKRAGASWRGLCGAIGGGLLGGLFLTAIPVIGTLFGALLGALAGMWLVEYTIRHNSQLATATVWAYVKGVFLSTLLEVLISLGMVGFFTWQLFF
jgi:uncharacterized protein YqgC (DUF456 family)